jgi:hypothetical protein
MVAEQISRAVTTASSTTQLDQLAREIWRSLCAARQASSTWFRATPRARQFQLGIAESGVTPSCFPSSFGMGDPVAAPTAARMGADYRRAQKRRNQFGLSRMGPALRSLDRRVR